MVEVVMFVYDLKGYCTLIDAVKAKVVSSRLDIPVSHRDWMGKQGHVQQSNVYLASDWMTMETATTK